MPLTDKGTKILAGMRKQYGEKRGEEVFYASKNSGTITGVDSDDVPRTRGAGVMFVAPPGKILFLQRGDGGDYPNYWCFPGGHTEGDETAEQTARREAEEELGSMPKGEMSLLSRTCAAGNGPPQPANATAPALVDFTTFIQKVDAEFVPVLNGEHTAWTWTAAEQPPQPLHPGCEMAIRRLSMDERGVAQAIADGGLVSPQRYMNVWLFALRITGTGVAYRRKLDEFVWRDPAVYLNDEFMQRCNGLPVIFTHPEKSILTSADFAEKVVGTVVLPYIVGDEVWGVAKIYDDDAAKIMQEKQLSTSPAVVLRGPNGDNKLELENGSKLLIEGKPSLLDHLAICEHGVWDKGGEPTGVATQLTTGDTDMVEIVKKADAESTPDKMLVALDALNSKLDSMSKRMDSMEEGEKKKADAEEAEKAKAKADAEEAEKKAKADANMSEDEKKKKADAEEAEKAKAKADAEEAEKKAKADAAEEEKKKADAAGTASTADLAAIRAAIDGVAARMPKQMSDADYHKMADAQALADGVFQAFGDSAPRPLDGETLLGYRRRLATALKPHSKAWAKVELTAIADETAFGIAEGQIYADAMAAAASPEGLPEGQLRAITKTDTTGRKITTFHGEPRAWMQAFSSNRRRLAGIRNSQNR